jgi:hypothetical protein
MSEEETKELKSILKNHASWIAKLTLDENSGLDNDYILLAGILRVLLCDAKMPILISYGKEKNIPLKIVFYPTQIEKNPELYKNSVFYLRNDSSLPHWDSLRTGDTVCIEEFLDKPIGILGGTYTARKIIKWVANKEGISHLDFKKPATLKDLKSMTHVSGDNRTEGFVIQNVIYSLARWALITIQFVLNLDKLFANASHTLSNLKAIQHLPPNNLERITHYVLIHQSIHHTYFEGEHGFYVENMNHVFSDKIGVHTLLCILSHQLNSGTTNIYKSNIGLPNDYGTISIQLIEKQYLLFSYKYKEKQSVINIDLKDKNVGIGNYFSLSFELEFTEKLVKLSASINGENNYRNELKYNLPISSRIILNQIVGGNQSKEISASFFMTELILCKNHLENNKLKSLSKYFWLSIFDKHNSFKN